MRKSDRVIVEVVVAAPIDVVWRALREPPEIARWFGWEHAGFDEEVDFIFHKASTASEEDHTIRAIDMPERIALEAVGDQTIVRVIRSAPVSDVSWQGIYDDTFEGWTTCMQQLRFAIEHQRGAARRTLFSTDGRVPPARRFPPKLSAS